MIVDCHSCGATYNISDEKIRGRRVRVRCKTCNEGIIVDGTQLDPDEATRVYSPTFEPVAYAKGVHDEATRVMAPSGPDLRAAASTDEWTVAVADAEQRQMDLAELISSYTGGLIPDDALVWREGMDDWQRIRDVPEVQAAIESNEATHVVSPAMAVRAPRRAVGDRPVPRRAEAQPARAQLPSMVDVDQFAAPSAADAAPAAPVTEPATARGTPAPEDLEASKQQAPALADVSAPPRRTRAAPPPGRERAAARVREGRAGGADLFGNVESAGAEEALLGSTALSQYEEKPIGARNESSVLFSLDALKAGARRTSSAPPRHAPSAPQQTAADILGLSAGGALPGIAASGNPLLSAAAPDLPLAGIPTTPPRSKMDTLPPVMRARRSSPLPYAVAAGAVIVATMAFLVIRAHLRGHPEDGAQTMAAEPRAEPTTPVAKEPESPPPKTAEPAPAETQAKAAETPEPSVAAHVAQAAPAETRPSEPSRGAQGDGINAPVLPTKPSPTVTSSQTSASRYEAAKAAMRPDKPEGESKPEPPASDKPSKGVEKVVLAEEPSSDDKGEGAPAEEAPKPPFDTSAAKAALEAASASASSCKTDDGPTGRGKVQVTFAPTGRATSANVIEGPFGGTSVGGCVAKLFRAAKVPAFSGDAVTVAKSFTIPE
ncbi:MAG TPA: zinc-ribbon domain-containing protein [Polyangiaceae bacterium]|nr:zinc-ribbon domain-containing protein [Polyangiaceae bacterium]